MYACPDFLLFRSFEEVRKTLQEPQMGPGPQFGNPSFSPYLTFPSSISGLGKTKRKMSARDASPTPSTDAEFPSNGSAGGAERIYDLSIPAVVKFAYTAEREDELSLVKGARVVVMEKCSDGWWRGSSAGQAGWFPSNYVLEENDSEAAALDPSQVQGGGGYQRVGGAIVVSNGQSAGSSVTRWNHVHVLI